MSYARNLLSRGEEVVFQSRQHWFAVVARAWLWIVLAVVSLAIVIFVMTNEQIVNPEIDGILTIVAIVLLIAALGYIGFIIWDWRNQEWLITTRRVIRAEGVLNKSMADSSLEKINDARLDQSLFGRIFGFGTLDILTAAEELGGSNVADFPMIADPIEFKRAMLDQKEMLERPDLARPRAQRQQPMPEMQRAEPMAPRAGSNRVMVHADEGGEAEAAEAGTGSPRSAAVPPAESAKAPEPAPRSTADELGETLERLAGLRDRGLITAEEYDAKKRELLERM